MKSFIIFFLLIFSSNSFSQEKKPSYHFDYYTVYDYKESEKKNSKTSNILAFSNSKDSTYILTLILKKEEVVYATLFDHANSISYIYKLPGFLKNYNDVRLFNSASTVSINNEPYINNHKFLYKVEYNKNSFSIKTYKNNKKQKFVTETFFVTKPSSIVQNQNYNQIMLFAPLWCNKFTLKNKEVIDNSYFIVKGKKKHIRKLLEITKTDFTINIDSTKNTQQ